MIHEGITNCCDNSWSSSIFLWIVIIKKKKKYRRKKDYIYILWIANMNSIYHSLLGITVYFQNQVTFYL